MAVRFFLGIQVMTQLCVVICQISCILLWLVACLQIKDLLCCILQFVSSLQAICTCKILEYFKPQHVSPLMISNPDLPVHILDQLRRLSNSQLRTPSKNYCTNGGRFPWWKACCKWKDNKCVPNGNGNICIA